MLTVDHYELIRRKVRAGMTQRDVAKAWGHARKTGAKELGVPPEDVSATFALLDRVGLNGYQDTRADALSGGQRQRVGIARALMQRPELLLVDEPTASLDPKTARQIMRLLVELAHERGTPALINIHDVALAQAHADRIVGLSGGVVVFDGPPQAVTHQVLTDIYGEEDWSTTIRKIDEEEDQDQDTPHRLEGESAAG